MTYIVTSKTRELARRGLKQTRRAFPSTSIKNGSRHASKPIYNVGSLHQRTAILNKIESLDRKIHGRAEDGFDYKKPDSEELKVLIHQRDHYVNHLENIQPKSLRQAKRDKAVRRMRDIARIIQDTAMSKDQENDKVNARENGERLVRWNRKMKPLIREYQNISRNLEPEDPGAGNINKLKKGFEKDTV